MNERTMCLHFVAIVISQMFGLVNIGLAIYQNNADTNASLQLYY